MITSITETGIDFTKTLLLNTEEFEALKAQAQFFKVCKWDFAIYTSVGWWVQMKRDTVSLQAAYEAGRLVGMHMK